MIQITVKQNGATYSHLFSTDKDAQRFLEHLQKAHIKQNGLDKIESLKKQTYLEKQKCLDSEFRRYVMWKCENRVKKELNALPVKPPRLRVEILNLGNLL